MASEIDPAKDFLDDDLLGIAHRVANNAIQSAEIADPRLVGFGGYFREHIVRSAHEFLRTVALHERQRAGRDTTGLFPTHFNDPADHPNGETDG